jgi:hypothetical protein
MTPSQELILNYPTSRFDLCRLCSQNLVAENASAAPLEKSHLVVPDREEHIGQPRRCQQHLKQQVQVDTDLSVPLDQPSQEQRIHNAQQSRLRWMNYKLRMISHYFPTAFLKHAQRHTHMQSPLLMTTPMVEDYFVMLPDPRHTTHCGDLKTWTQRPKQQM